MQVQILRTFLVLTAAALEAYRNVYLKYERDTLHLRSATYVWVQA